MNSEKSLWSILANHTLQPIQSLFDLEANFFFEQKETPPNFLTFFSNHGKLPSEEDPLKNRFFSIKKAYFPLNSLL